MPTSRFKDQECQEVIGEVVLMLAAGGVLKINNMASACHITHHFILFTFDTGLFRQKRHTGYGLYHFCPNML